MADANCIQIRAPLFGSDFEGANFEHGQHIGHVTKECAKVLAKLMDEGFEATAASSFENPVYMTGYEFSALLTYTDTNRSKSGYDIDIIVHSDNSTSWINAMFLFLSDQGLKPILLK